MTALATGLGSVSFVHSTFSASLAVWITNRCRILVLFEIFSSPTTVFGSFGHHEFDVKFWDRNDFIMSDSLLDEVQLFETDVVAWPESPHGRF